MKVTLFKTHDVTRVQKDITADIIEGQAEQHVELKFCEHDDKIKSGIWESTAGVFTADYDGIVEFCHILEGEAWVKAEDGTVTHVSAGDGFVLEAELKTQWTVKTFVKKHFMICQL